MDYNTIFTVLGICVVAAPAVLVAAMGLMALLDRSPSEAAMGQLTQAAVVTGLLAAIAILGLMLLLDTRHVPIELGNWVIIPEQHFHFKLKFVFDRLSVPFVILSYLLCGTVGAFAHVYLLREPGRMRFFLLYALFLLGMIVTSLSGTIETLFFGWELVGLSSALLVAFFQDRAAPARNGQWVWTVYRVADAAFLVAALTMHHLTGGGEFDKLMGAGPWPEGQAALTPNQALFVGALLLVAAAGKSGLIPFTGWLPRAMEGPTPSSAIFYGALSVHLGAFLLLRVSPILKLSPLLCAAIVTLGLLTAILAAMAARVQSDVKSALAFSSATQVGIIVAEIGLGLYYIALAHILGHACLRTLQLLRAPTLLRDYATLENAIGARLSHPSRLWERSVPAGLRLWLYRLALERGYLDAWLADYGVRPVVHVFQWCDRMERKWTDFLSGGQSRESDRVQPSPETLERLEKLL
jgi:NAD(P)H-quinone oxidoreductase subunit 5